MADELTNESNPFNPPSKETRDEIILGDGFRGWIWGLTNGLFGLMFIYYLMGAMFPYYLPGGSAPVWVWLLSVSTLGTLVCTEISCSIWRKNSVVGSCRILYILLAVGWIVAIRVAIVFAGVWMAVNIAGLYIWRNSKARP